MFVILRLGYLAPVHPHMLPVRRRVLVVLRRQRVIGAERSRGQNTQPNQRTLTGSREALLNSGTRVCDSALASVVWLRGVNGLGLPRDVNPKTTSTRKSVPPTSKNRHCGDPFLVALHRHDLKFRRHLMNAPDHAADAAIGSQMQRSTLGINQIWCESIKFGAQMKFGQPKSGGAPIVLQPRHIIRLF